MIDRLDHYVLTIFDEIFSMSMVFYFVVQAHFFSVQPYSFIIRDGPSVHFNDLFEISGWNITNYQKKKNKKIKEKTT